MLAKDVPQLDVTVTPLKRRRAGQIAWLRCEFSAAQINSLFR